MMNIPGLNDALKKLEVTQDQMNQLVVGIERLTELIEEQNEIMRGWNQDA